MRAISQQSLVHGHQSALDFLLRCRDFLRILCATFLALQVALLLADHRRFSHLEVALWQLTAFLADLNPRHAVDAALRMEATSQLRVVDKGRGLVHVDH